VRIEGWRVDGYGILADHAVDGLPPGLTVVHGPNEAGKSTLLDFVSGVLFGYPDRRHRQGVREPLRGGRHGGALRLADESGGSWLLERHADARAPVLTGPDGHAGDTEDLRRLLGGADAGLFRSVFAFGLDELASLATLEADEVRDLVFSAGVLGAGRSATRAARALEQRQAAIVRPRRQDALANGLRRRLDEVEAELRKARAAAADYPVAAGAAARLDEEVAATARRCEALRDRGAELDRLATCWPIWARRRDAADRLAELGPLEHAARGLLALEGEVRRLAADRSGHEHELARSADLTGQLHSIEGELDKRLAEVGPGADPGRLGSPEAGAELLRQARSVAEQHREGHAELRALDAEAERARDNAARALEALESPGREDHVRSGLELGELGLALRELRGRVAERDQLAAGVAEAERARRLAAIAAGAHRRELPAARLVAAVLGLVAVALGATGASAFHGHRNANGAVLVALAVVVLVLVGVLVGASRRAAARASSAPPEPPPPELDRTVAAVAALAKRLGMPAEPTQVDLDTATARLEVERDGRRNLDELERAAGEARRRAAEAARRAEERRASLGVLERRAAELAADLGLGTELSPDRLVVAIDHLRAAQKLEEARLRVRTELDALGAKVAAYEAAVARVVRLRSGGQDGPGTATTAGHTDAGATDQVVLLERDLEEALAARRERAEVERVARLAEEDLARALGSDAGAQRLGAELATGAVLAWEQERARLAVELADAVAEHERVLQASIETRRNLDALLGSDEVARLELEREALVGELEAALEQWVVLGLARGLLERTLARYEQERQPAVIHRAGTLFAEVTAGRYVQLVAREETDAVRSHGIDVISATGGRVDAGRLSRGTAEQLYLCLRLALAATFAERAVALPLLLDDVLVNFDPERAGAVARAVAATAARHQVLAFTCHPHVVELLRSADPTARLVELGRHVPV